MTKRESLKREIETLPDKIIEELYNLVHPVPEKKHKKSVRTYKLNGQYDNVDLRRTAYE
jgi:hypothetical protein